MTNSEKLKATYPELRGEPTIFERFILWLYHSKKDFSITHGLVYGHPMYKLGRYTVIEISPEEVVVEADDFYYKATSVVSLIEVVQAIR